MSQVPVERSAHRVLAHQGDWLGNTRPLIENIDDAEHALNRRMIAALSYLYEFIPSSSGEALLQ